ncbi:HTH-type transcriptional repressor NemR [Vibrio vulnificus]|nr:HTH-type transcriptional repressor NemR [Vibrio vulnificus]
MGLSQLLKEAGVPKGSFYHYFKSKEQFGQALIEEYFHQYLARLEAHFNQQNDSGFDDLISYFSRWLSIENGVCNANRCLVVKLSAEVSDLSEAMRHTLSQGAQRVILALASAVQTGIDDGSISVNNATATAQQLYQQWLGASLLNKLMQDQTHLEQCLASTKKILKG